MNRIWWFRYEGLRREKGGNKKGLYWRNRVGGSASGPKSLKCSLAYSGFSISVVYWLNGGLNQWIQAKTWWLWKEFTTSFIGIKSQVCVRYPNGHGNGCWYDFGTLVLNFWIILHSPFHQYKHFPGTRNSANSLFLGKRIER